MAAGFPMDSQCCLSLPHVTPCSDLQLETCGEFGFRGPAGLYGLAVVRVAWG